MAKAPKPKPRRTKRTPAAGAPTADRPCTCLTHFFSPLSRRPLPEPVARAARADGLVGGGSIAAGFSPGAFSFTLPGTFGAGVLADDATWGRGAHLKVHFRDPGPTGFQRKVEQYANGWADVCNVRFTFGVGRSESHIRISFARPRVFQSAIGREGLNALETMSLGFGGAERDEEVRRLVLHEFGHALGWMHEHQHPESGIEWDDDGAYNYFKDLLPLDRAGILKQLHAINPQERRYKLFPFDSDSIMLYKIEPECIKPGRYKPEYGKHNTVLSASDKAIAAMVYGGDQPPPQPIKLEVNGPPVADSISQAVDVDLFFFEAPSLARYTITVTGDALVHVNITDKDGNPPRPDDPGGHTITPSVGLTMTRLLDPGRQNVRVTGSSLASGAVGGAYSIRVTQAP